MIPRAASFKLLIWALGFAAIGLIDLALPPGIAVWVLYLAPIWFASTPRLMVITACISSALLVLVFATTLPGSFSWGVGLNQFIAVLAIWGFTLVVIRYRPRSSIARRHQDRMRYPVLSAPSLHPQRICARRSGLVPRWPWRRSYWDTSACWCFSISSVKSRRQNGSSTAIKSFNI